MLLAMTARGPGYSTAMNPEARRCPIGVLDAIRILDQTATTPAIPPVTDPKRGLLWDDVGHDFSGAERCVGYSFHLPVRNRDARERVVRRHAPLRSVAPLATLASTRRTSSTPNQISNGRSGSGDRWKAQHLSRLLGGQLRRHAHANTLNNVPSHARRH
jgi:hypothetical protein